MAIYFAHGNFDVAISRSKRRVRRFAKYNLQFGAGPAQTKFGCCNRQTFDTPTNFKAQFGPSVIYDLDQKIVYRNDFSIVRCL